jgi:hypothetical protein
MMKTKNAWLTAHGDTVTYIPRPAAGASYGGLNRGLYAQALQTD